MSETHHHHHGERQDGAGPAIDAVCGMTVDPRNTPHHAEYKGGIFHFCSAKCRETFVSDPAPHLSHGSKPATDAARAGVIYTCPMHPEVRQIGPGACPKCGMALEPESGLAEDAGEAVELTQMTRRFWVGLILTAPAFVIEMSGHVLSRPLLMGPPEVWMQLVLATPVVVWAGAPFFHRGWMSLVHRSLNMFTLIALGVGVAYAYSLVAALAPQLFPTGLRDAHGMVPLYFEAAAVITVLALLGQVLELRARQRTSGALRALMDLSPKSARRIAADGADEDVDLNQVGVGDHLRVRPGEKVPVDGEIVEGRVAIDESLVTGESMPVTKGPGDKVIGGSLNRTGAFVLRAEKVGADTVLARIVAMVAQAQRSRAPIQRMADRVSAWFVPAVMAVAVVAFASWMVVGPEPRLAYGLVAAVSVLIIACPCALGLATPISIMVGVGRGAQAGVLIKNAEALERFEAIDTLVIDKTGTLTEGRPSLVAIEAAPGVDEADLLRLSASLERGSEHPLADAITRAAQARSMTLASPTTFDSPVGKGVLGDVEGRAVIIGSGPFLAEHGVKTTDLEPAAERHRTRGATAIFVGVDGRAAGVLAIADPIKSTTAAAISALRAEGISLVMMTGDNRTTALAVAKTLGIDQVEADVAPEGKAAVVTRLRNEGRRVAMAGDGVNDAPALAAAEVGVAMGGGSDVAVESAGVTLLRGDLQGLVRARTLSRAVMRNIRQNLVFAFAYNLAGVPLAAGLLYPVTGRMLSPAIAALAMALSSVSVITNALRLRSVKL